MLLSDDLNDDALVDPSFRRHWEFSRDLPRTMIRQRLPVVEATVSYPVHRSIIYCIVGLFAVIARCEPCFTRFEWSGDSMGDATLDMELKGNGMMLSMAYEDNLSDTWQSVSRKTCSVRFEGHPYTELFLDAYMNASGTLTVALFNLDRNLIREIEILAAQCFETSTDR